MKNKISLILLFAMLASSAGAASDMKSFVKKDIHGSDWRIRIDVPKNWKFNEIKTVKYCKNCVFDPKEAIQKVIYNITFAKSNACLDGPDRTGCEGNFTMSIETGLKRFFFNSNKGERRVPFKGAKGDYAYRGKDTLRFRLPDGKVMVTFTGRGDLFEKIIQGVKISK